MEILTSAAEMVLYTLELKSVMYANSFFRGILAKATTSFRESNKGSKERQGLTLSGHYREVSVSMEVSVKGESIVRSEDRTSCVNKK